MPTYAENAHRREVAQRRQMADAIEGQRHRMFDAQAQDKHHKHDRPQFAVVGEGSRTAQENYARGYDRIFAPPPAPAPRRRVGISFGLPSRRSPTHPGREHLPRGAGAAR